MALSALVKERYDAALKSGDLLFFPGETKRKNANGVEFEITYAPALAEKPRLEVPQSEDGKKVKVNPFLPPNPALLVKDLDEHRVLLNKFCVTAHHLLIVTKEFKMQTEPLLPPDLLATWQCLTTAFDSTSAVAFYNCGPFSGASQQHKHVQIMPVPNPGPQPPIKALFNEIQERKAGQIYILEKLPFVHVITPLDRDFIESSSSTEHVEDYLGQMFFGLLDAMFHQLRKHATSYGREVSYNFVMTTQFMMLVPRSKEIAIIQHNNQDIQLSINSLGFAGLLLVKSLDQLAALEESSNLMELLQQVAVPWNPSAENDEMEQ